MVAQGTTLAGRYRLDQRIGAGGMGEVWRGEDTVLARTVAVKVLLPGRLDDPGFGARFQGEARAMATVNHPGVVDVYDYGVTDVRGQGPTAYLVMKFVDGEPLDRLLARLGRIGPEPAMELIAQAAAALQAVHDRGIVHRDVKPGNLLVAPDGRLVLTDFGIARSEALSRLTDAGMVLGTAAYCAPEQAEGEPVTPAVDIYALGVVAYECLAGHRPFDGDTPVTIALKHIREPVPPLPADIPPRIRHVVERALIKSPAERWPTATAMSQAAYQTLSTGTPGQPATAGYALQGAAPAIATATTVQQDAWAVAEPEPPYRVARDSWNEVPRTGAMTAMSAPMAIPAPIPGGRRRPGGAAKKGPMMALAAGLVAFAGIAVFGYNMLNAESGAPDPLPGPVVIETPTPTPTPKTSRPPRRSPSPSPSLSPSPSPSKPSPSPSSTPKPSRSPSPSPSPSPTPKGPLKRVPQLWAKTEDQAKRTLALLGFNVKVTFANGEATGCTSVIRQTPKAGVMWPVDSGVTILVKHVPCPATPTPSASPSPSA